MTRPATGHHKRRRHTPIRDLQRATSHEYRTDNGRQDRLPRGGGPAGDLRQAYKPLLPHGRNDPRRRPQYAQHGPSDAETRRGRDDPAQRRGGRLPAAARRTRHRIYLHRVRAVDAETHVERRQTPRDGHRRPLRILGRGLRPRRRQVVSLAHDILPTRSYAPSSPNSSTAHSPFSTTNLTTTNNRPR